MLKSKHNKGDDILKNFYQKIHKFFSKGIQFKILKFIYKKIPMFMAASYLLLLGFLAITWDIKIILAVIVPAFIFLSVTVFRKLFNFQRPYEKMDLPPLISKDKKGETFPSRHCASAFAISGAFFYTNIYPGIFYTILALLVALSRIFAGVHFVRDVLAAALYSCALSSLYFIIPYFMPLQ